MVPEPPDSVVAAFIEEHPAGAGVEEIARVFGCSHQRIQQVIAKALAKLRLRMFDCSVSDFVSDQHPTSPAQRMVQEFGRNR